MMTNGFGKLLADLSRADVDFVVVGGLAVAFCGYVRATEDVDILVRATKSNIRRLLRVLESFGEGAASELSPDDFTIEEGAIRIVESFPVDVFTLMKGYLYEDMKLFFSEREIGGQTILYLNAEGLIELKKDSLRPKDQMDVQALRELS